MPNAFLYGVGGKLPTLAELSVSANGTYNASDFSVDGFSVVNVSVQGSAALEDGDLYLMGMLTNVSTQSVLSLYSPLTTFRGSQNTRIFSGRLTEYQLLKEATIITATNSIFLSTLEALSHLTISATTNRNLSVYGYLNNLVSLSLNSYISIVSFSKLSNTLISELKILRTPSTFNTYSFPKNGKIVDFTSCSKIVLGAYTNFSVDDTISFVASNLTSIVSSTNAQLNYDLILTGEDITTVDVRLFSGSVRFSSYSNVLYATPKTLRNVNFNSLRALYNCNNILLSEFNFQSLIGLYDNCGYNVCLKVVNLPMCSALGASMNYCTNLREVRLPLASTIHGFSRCFHLSKVVLLSNTVCVLNDSTAFDNTPMTNSDYLTYWGSIYVPSSLVEEYKIATNWTLISDRITAYTEE